MSDKVIVGEHLKLENQLCFALYDASRKVTQLYRSHLKEMNLTYPQYLVIMVLWERGRLTVKELGDRLNLDSGTLTPLLKRLEKGDFLTRTRSKKDERELIVSLTEKGKSISNNADCIPEKLLCSFGLPTEKVFQLRDDLQEFCTSVEKVKKQLEEENQ